MAAPNTTLYIKNLNEKTNKNELRSQLYAVFMTYGKVIDVVATKSPKMRGQAFIVFSNLAEATTALRACEGMIFYDKPMHIHYGKSKSYATLKKEDPNFIPPSAQLVVTAQKQANDKRPRDGPDEAESSRNTKRERSSNDDDDEDDEMELEDEDDSSAQKSKQAPSGGQQQPSARLLCSNLPEEVTESVLSVLFQQYKGFQSAMVAQAAPSPNGVKSKIAQAFFENPALASVAKEALDGFTLKKGWNMSVAYC